LVEETGISGENRNLLQVIHKLYHIMLHRIEYTSLAAGFEL
jgi:hypothetical protein